MLGNKKILSLTLKILLGVLCIGVIFYKLKNDFTPQNLSLLSKTFFNPLNVLALIFAALLIPVNWGIEALKWKKITHAVQQINFSTSLKSTVAGICLGNLAPGRATEFVAKIFFFKPENRSKITVLHFVNGMFQLCITIIAGSTAILLSLNAFSQNKIIVYVTFILAITVFVVFIFSLIKIKWVLNFVTKKFNKNNQELEFEFTKELVLYLFGYSILRYSVFIVQFLLVIFALTSIGLSINLILGIAMYFLITTIIPMISFIEPAVRAAVAVIVFSNCGIGNLEMVFSGILIWILNIVIPSIFGYVVLINQKFNFNFSKKPA